MSICDLDFAVAASPGSIASPNSKLTAPSSNKFRDIIKRFDATSAACGENGLATTKPTNKRTKPAATKKGATAATAETGGDNGEDDSGEDEPPKKARQV